MCSPPPTSPSPPPRPRWCRSPPPLRTASTAWAPAISHFIVTFSSPVTVAGRNPDPCCSTPRPPRARRSTPRAAGPPPSPSPTPWAANQDTDTLDCGSSSALQLNGSALTDSFGLGVTVVVPIGSATGALPFNSQICIETTAPSALPTITSVTSLEPSGTYLTGQQIFIVLTMSTPVTVTGTPQLFLNDQGTTNARPVATYVIGSGSNTLFFSYTIVDGQSTPQLDVFSSSALALSGGTISDPFRTASLTLPHPGSGGAHFRGARPSRSIPTPRPAASTPPNQAATPTTPAGGEGCRAGWRCGAPPRGSRARAASPSTPSAEPRALQRPRRAARPQHARTGALTGIVQGLSGVSGQGGGAMPAACRRSLMPSW